MRKRRAAAASEREYNVEASQVQGPPTIIATEYNPRSGPSPVYSSGHKSAQFDIGHLSPAPQMSGPSFPATAHHYNNYTQPPPAYISQNHTAPVSQVSFPDQPYPFGGYSPVSRSPFQRDLDLMTHLSFLLLDSAWDLPCPKRRL
ncbi:hypothetical protein BDZ97DRAFT_1809517 [Flammula alnicola]|nr:hypothetical protein BDZ97DRAFT_1809517 [Flammula alnicola]